MGSQMDQYWNLGYLTWVNWGGGGSVTAKSADDIKLFTVLKTIADCEELQVGSLIGSFKVWL